MTKTNCLRILYSIFLFTYRNAIRFASIWDEKARHWVSGRKQPVPAFEKPVVWMHCASLGEFEQGRPVFEAVKLGYPNYSYVVTFFSPSGYLIRKNYAGADAVLYLPSDSPDNAKRFIRQLNPALVLWVKYEYWFYHLTAIQRNNIPLLLISGIFRPSQPFFKWYGSMWRTMLGRFTAIFVQNEDSLKLLGDINLSDNASLAGDTRFDRVVTVAESFTPLPDIAHFCGGSDVIVAGSTWEEDEEVLLHYIKQHPDIKFIIAPHEVDEENIRDVQEMFPDAIRYSQWKDTKEEKHVLIIDSIGLLNRLYQYATVTYIGGGFRDSGIHNTLEAAVYGKPVVFGPVYQKFNEAVDLIDNGAAFSIENALKLEQTLNSLFNNAHLIAAAGNAAKNYVYSKKGATEKILNYIQRNRLLTN